jgi:UDP-2-acetamido-3-amino-2,3-dideoxy-glucuronate N-acetyltransferase
MSPTNERDLALIGAGHWGRNLARNFLDLGALHTLCDLSQETLDAYGAEYGGIRKTGDVDSVIADPAVKKVAIAAPAGLHFRLARSALLAGKDVFVEKPICLDKTEGEELVTLAERHGRMLMVGHLLQYHPCVEKLLSLVAKGELGRLYYVTSNRLNLGKIRYEENALWSFAPHDISVILSLAGNQLPEQVGCSGGSYLQQGVADTTLMTLKFASGLRAHVYVSWLNPFKEQKLTVVGSGGMAVFDDTRPWSEKLMLHREYLTWTDGQVPTPNKRGGEPVSVPEAEPLRAECRHFLEKCRDRSKPRTDGYEGLRVLRVLQAAQRSLEGSGEAVSLTSSQAKPHYFAHPSAIVDEGAQIGEGSRIWHFAHVCAGARIGTGVSLGQNVFVGNKVVIGDRCKIQNNVSVYDNVILEEGVFCGPSMVFTNVYNPRALVERKNEYRDTVVKKGATLGANCTIICGVTIGEFAFVGAGAVINDDVPTYALMVGVPARQIGWMSRHGERLDLPLTGAATARCSATGDSYQLVEGVVTCLSP